MNKESGKKFREINGKRHIRPRTDMDFSVLGQKNP